MINLKYQFAEIKKHNDEEEQRRIAEQAQRADAEFRQQISSAIYAALRGYGIQIDLCDITLDAEYCWWNEGIYYTAIASSQPIQFQMGGRCPICKNRCGYHVTGFADIERVIREVEADTIVHEACSRKTPFEEEDDVFFPMPIEEKTERSLVSVDMAAAESEVVAQVANRSIDGGKIVRTIDGVAQQ